MYLCTCCTVNSDTKIIAALTIGDEWPETPDFALFNDGTVIYLRKQENQKPLYYKVVLDDNKFQEIKTELFSDTRFFSLSDYYDYTSSGSWHCWLIIMLHNNNIKKEVKVNGMYSTGKTVMELFYQKEIDKEIIAFKRILKILTNFENQKSYIWKPPIIEIDLNPFDNAKKTKNWPMKWPGLNANETKKILLDPDIYVNKEVYKKYKYDYTIYLSGTEIINLHNFETGIDIDEAVLIDGLKFSFNYLYIIPEDEYWNQFRKYRIPLMQF